MLDWRQLMFNTPINNRFKSGTFLSQKIEIIKTENQIKFCTKIDQDGVRSKVIHFNTNNKFSCEVACLNNDRRIQR